MSDYIPPTSDVRQTWVDMWSGEQTEDAALAEFDRWLTRVLSEAWEEGHESGIHAASLCRCPNHPNPYRGGNNND